MSGNSYSQYCCKCNSDDSLMVSEDSKPFPNVSGECIECGFSYWTKTGTMDLFEVNEMRLDRELEPLTELKKQEV